VAKRNTGRRGRSRKRRAGTPAAGTAGETRRRTRPAPSDAGAYRDPLSVGERPRAPWHPLPLSELLILVGAIGTIVGFRRLGSGGFSSGGPTLLAGIAAVAIGTVEVTLREHLSGYRSHTLMLALLPTVALHSIVILLVAAVTQVPRWLNIPLLAVDALLARFLFKLLRLRFLDARRERTFARGR
jgi:hypothetical protein